MKEAPNIKDVASLAGVSISTVSRVINRSGNVGKEIREKVNRAIRQTGYSANPIASNLKGTKRNQIAIVIPTLKRNYYTDLIKGISDFFYEKNVITTVLESDGKLEKERTIIENLERQWIDGIILIPGQYKEDETYRAYARSLQELSKRDVSIPVVLLESYDMNPNLDVVRMDYEQALYAMTEHLLEIGRRKLLYLGAEKNTPQYSLHRKAIQDAMTAYGCTLEEDRFLAGNSTVLDGYYSMERFLQTGKKVDGVLCPDDQIAAGVVNLCRERGISVPQEVAVIGFGGVALSIVVTPSITTMIAPRYELGTLAARRLYMRMTGDEEPAQTEELRAHMAIRESTMKSAQKHMDVMFAE